jgi:hypothetical protein
LDFYTITPGGADASFAIRRSKRASLQALMSSGLSDDPSVRVRRTET